MKNRIPDFFKTNWLNNIEKFAKSDNYYINDLSKLLADYIGVKYCYMTNSGTSALYLGIKALGLKENDEIILPNFGFKSMNNISKYLNLSIKYIDVKYDTFCMNPNLVENEITDKTKAICFINHLGYVGNDIQKIKDIADKHNVLFFEDSCQCLGNFYNNHMGGTFGEFGTLSFSWPKIIRTDQGGCLFTNNENIYNYAVNHTYNPFNFEMSFYLQGLIKAQFSDIKILLEMRKNIFCKYEKYIKSICKPFVSDNFSGYNNIAITNNNAKNITEIVKKFMQNKNYNSKNIVRYKMFKPYSDKPVSNKLYENYFELPCECGFDLSEEDIKVISRFIL
jgi:dTDP-4-amino-4,6-dideoxygalactose transaminase